MAVGLCGHPPNLRQVGPVDQYMHDIFRKFAAWVSRMVGSGWAVLIATGLIAGTGVYFNFSTEWKNNFSLIAHVTALALIFFLQKSQNHNDKATHLKLDELIKAADGARNEIVSAEHQPAREIDELRKDV